MTFYSPENPLFLDHMSTTPVASEVQQVMFECLKRPHSAQVSKRLIAKAQKQVASLIGAKADEIIFTSGATEANNLAIFGTCPADNPRKTILTTQLEHSSVLEPVRRLVKQGYNVEFLSLTPDGLVDLTALSDRLGQNDVGLVSVQGANNELPIRQPIEQIAALVKQQDCMFHVDASQSIIGQQLDVSQFPADMVSISSQKIYGPQGVGALFIRRGANLHPLMHGGSQQYGIRPGTLPLFLILGFAEASLLALENKRADKEHLEILSRVFMETLSSKTDRFEVHQFPSNSGNPALLSLRLNNIPAEEVLDQTPELIISTGAACESEQGHPSHVLKAMGYSSAAVSETLRVGMGRYVTRQDVIFAANIIGNLVK